MHFIQHAYRMRVLGLGLGFFSVASVFYQSGIHPLVWVLLLLHSYAWPHLAYLLARHPTDFARTQLRNSIVDSAMSGAWIALMAFNLLPSVLLASLFSLDKLALGGWPLLARAFAVQVAACLIIAALLEFPFAPSTSMLTMLGCVPLLVIYPFAIVTQIFTLSGENSQHRHALDALSYLDALTGLLNRRYFEQAAAGKLSDHFGSGSSAVLLLIDIDEFKQINDRYGHTVGDEVLQRVAVILRNCIRNDDIPGRYGGDEFGLVLLKIDLAGALRVAERIRDAVQTARFKRIPELCCTVSLGVAEAAQDIDTLQAWIHRADSALYLSKAAGRNRVSTPPS